jgi:hypothetical protein
MIEHQHIPNAEFRKLCERQLAASNLSRDSNTLRRQALGKTGQVRGRRKGRQGSLGQPDQRIIGDQYTHQGQVRFHTKRAAHWGLDRRHRTTITLNPAGASIQSKGFSHPAAKIIDARLRYTRKQTVIG